MNTYHYDNSNISRIVNCVLLWTLSFLDTPFVWPTGGKLSKIWFYFVWPLKLILFVTVPDSRYKRWKKWYPLTFVMCVIWIAITSYLVSWMMSVVGDTLGISDSIMGLTFLAAGGNMPELISIVILSRQGEQPNESAWNLSSPDTPTSDDPQKIIG